MSITNLEKETIINYNVAEPNAEIYTHDPKLIGKINKLVATNPTLYKITSINESGGVSCVMPKNLLTVALRAPLSLHEIEKRKLLGRRNGDLSKVRQCKQENKNK